MAQLYIEIEYEPREESDSVDRLPELGTGWGLVTVTSQ